MSLPTLTIRIEEEYQISAASGCLFNSDPDCRQLVFENGFGSVH